MPNGKFEPRCSAAAAPSRSARAGIGGTTNGWSSPSSAAQRESHIWWRRPRPVSGSYSAWPRHSSRSSWRSRWSWTTATCCGRTTAWASCNLLIDVLPTHAARSGADLPFCPPLRVGRLRVEGRLGEIRTEDPGFTMEETAAVLAVEGVALSDAGLRQLVGGTEGWPTAIYLACRLWSTETIRTPSCSG